MLTAGFRARLGWATAVLLEGTPATPTFVDRRKVTLMPGDGGFPYHAALDAPPEDRPGIIGAGIEASKAHVLDVIEDMVGADPIESVGVVVGRGTGRIPLDKVLASNRLFHAAEAAVYYEGIVDAARTIGLPVTTIGFGEVEHHQFWDTATALRAQAGAPWQKDHKMAAVAGLLAMVDSAPP